MNFNEILTDYCTSKAEIVLAFHFGSSMKGEEGFASDVDLGVVTNVSLDSTLKQTIMEEISILVHRPVDLIDLSSANGSILEEIICRGQIIVNKDPVIYENLIKKQIYYDADFKPLHEKMMRGRLDRMFS